MLTFFATHQALSLFFKEKNLDERIYIVFAPNGKKSYISTSSVIEAILDAPAEEQQSIATMLSQIDSLNGNVHHFLKHLAETMATRDWFLNV